MQETSEMGINYLDASKFDDSNAAITRLEDGWYHVERENTTGATIFLNALLNKEWNNLKEDTTYTIMVETRNVDLENTKLCYLSVTGNIESIAFSGYSYNIEIDKLLSNTSNKWLIQKKTKIDFTDIIWTLATFIGVPAGGYAKFDYRISIYDANYTGDYVAFVPNKPSPLYSSQIKNIGDNINILDNNLIVIGTVNDVVGSEPTWSSNGSRAKFPTLQFLPNGNTFTISCNENYNIAMSEYGENNLCIKTSSWYTSYTFTKQANTTKISIKFKKVDNTAFSQEELKDIKCKLEKGSKATPYSKYGCGCIDLKVQNKNIFNKDDFEELSGSLANTNGTVIHSSTTEKTLYFKCKKNTKYAFQKLVGTNYRRFIVAETTELPKVNVEYKNRRDGTVNSKLVYTTSDTAEYLAFWYYSTGSELTKEEILNSIQIEENSEATDYIEHEEQTVTFPLAEGQVLHKEDYLAEDGIHHKRKTIEFDGTESWEANTVSTETQIKTISFFVSINNAKNSNTIDDICLCSHLKGGLTSLLYNADKESVWINTNRLYIRINRDKLATEDVEGIKEYLSSNNMTVEYPLQNEEIEAYTEEQQEAYDTIKELYSYEEVTHITCEDEIKTTQEVIYRKDFTLAQNNLQSQIDEIKASMTSEVSS